ncbi:hypothetical protein HDV00_005298 [Rhizophlyctis rosea]|nr:hypothetical protein HDV00_005298 [Rhizophlyctis rosea]
MSDNPTLTRIPGPPFIPPLPERKSSLILLTEFGRQQEGLENGPRKQESFERRPSKPLPSPPSVIEDTTFSQMRARSASTGTTGFKFGFRGSLPRPKVDGSGGLGLDDMVLKASPSEELMTEWGLHGFRSDDAHLPTTIKPVNDTARSITPITTTTSSSPPSYASPHSPPSQPIGIPTTVRFPFHHPSSPSSPIEPPFPRAPTPLPRHRSRATSFAFGGQNSPFPRRPTQPGLQSPALDALTKPQKTVTFSLDEPDIIYYEQVELEEEVEGGGGGGTSLGKKWWRLEGLFGEKEKEREKFWDEVGGRNGERGAVSRQNTWPASSGFSGGSGGASEILSRSRVAYDEPTVEPTVDGEQHVTEGMRSSPDLEDPIRESPPSSFGRAHSSLFPSDITSQAPIPAETQSSSLDLTPHESLLQISSSTPSQSLKRSHSFSIGIRGRHSIKSVAPSKDLPPNVYRWDGINGHVQEVLIQETLVSPPIATAKYGASPTRGSWLSRKLSGRRSTGELLNASGNGSGVSINDIGNDGIPEPPTIPAPVPPSVVDMFQQYQQPPERTSESSSSSSLPTPTSTPPPPSSSDLPPTDLPPHQPSNPPTTATNLKRTTSLPQRSKTSSLHTSLHHTPDTEHSPSIQPIDTPLFQGHIPIHITDPNHFVTLPRGGGKAVAGAETRSVGGNKLFGKVEKAWKRWGEGVMGKVVS